MALLRKTFEDLGLSSTTHDIYMQLMEKGACSARILADRINIPRTSVYEHLKLLIQKGLVVERFDEGKKIFSIDDPKNLPNLIDKEIESLQGERKRVADLLPSHLTKENTIEPKIKFYSGVEGVRHVLNDCKWQNDIATMAFWPIAEMINLLGDDFFDDLNRRRIKQNIYIRGIWPHGKGVKVKDHPFMGTGSEFLRELREAPKFMDWNMGYWIYGDKVAFISSSKEAFGFTIHSKDFCEMLTTQFEAVWRQSKAIEPDRKHTDPWINKISDQIGKELPKGFKIN